MARTRSASLASSGGSSSSGSSSTSDDSSVPETPGFASSISSSENPAHLGEQLRDEIVAEARTATSDERERRHQQATKDDQPGSDQRPWNRKTPSYARQMGIRDLTKLVEYSVAGLRRAKSAIASLGPQQAWALGLLTIYLLVWCFIARELGAVEGHGAASSCTALVIALKLLFEVVKWIIPMIKRILVASWLGFRSLCAGLWQGLLSSGPLLYWIGSWYLKVMAAVFSLAAILGGVLMLMLGLFSVGVAAAYEAQAEAKRNQALEKQTEHEKYPQTRRMGDEAHPQHERTQRQNARRRWNAEEEFVEVVTEVTQIRETRRRQPARGRALDDLVRALS